MNVVTRTTLLVALLVVIGSVNGQIPKPTDAPPPLTPEETIKSVKLPADLRLELVASEPLIREPSGVCWDERGRLFVCELHGFNVDGQIDIDEVNKTGKLDKVVRRFFVPEHVEEAAKAETYGTVKHLIDTDGDGRMDKAEIWADRLPASFGICPARGGIIVVCAPDIVFLADRDGDGKAEIQEVLYTGFSTGVLDRRMGNPQWGLDDWIYVGRSHSATTITGPHLAKPVELPNTDFRIKPDGSAIEPISGEVSGLGFTFTESGDRFVSSIGWPANLVVPLPWNSLARNPYVATPSLSMQVFPDRRVYPSSKAHPWRTKRSEDPGFAKFYTDGWGIAESAPNGYFTSCCGPLVYQDSVLPGLHGQLLACEPAQNLIHRSMIERDGPRHVLRRAKGEESSEFLTSTDPWFHPIALSHGPDGCVWIADFYREIIEDYSAIPRYLQQQYGVTNGKDHGRIWRIARNDHQNASTGKAGPSKSADLSKLSSEQLVSEVASPLFWRRETARRLLTERRQADAAPALIKQTRVAKEPASVINGIHTLDALGELKSDLLIALLTHPDSGVRRQVLQLAESRFNQNPSLLDAALKTSSDSDPLVKLQLAFSLGASRDPRIMLALAQLARQQGDDPWMATAVMSALADRGGEMLSELTGKLPELGNVQGLLEPLCAAIASRRQTDEFSKVLIQIAAVPDPAVRNACLRGVRKNFGASVDVAISNDAVQSVKLLLTSENPETRSLSLQLVRLMRLETPAEREARIASASKQLHDVAATTDSRIAAVAELITEDGPAVGSALVDGLATATPRIKEAILDAVFWRRDRIPFLLDAIEQKAVAPALLSAVQRNQLLNDKDESIRSRAGKLFQVMNVDSLTEYPRYVAALKEPRDTVRGEVVFRETCGKCHQAHGIGFAVGPDLSSEFQRAEETIIKDILAPSETISPGYMTYLIATTAGQTVTGLLASESPTSVTLKQPEGKQRVVLRNEIDELRTSAVSTMPEDLVKTLKPKDLADAIAWLRQPKQRVVLLDDNQTLADVLTDGTGTAQFITSDKFSGESSLQVTPPQRSASRIKGWEFRIRENPANGEYRYIRFAWKSIKASGIMIEFADDGQWPPADQTLRRYFAGKNLTGWQAVGIAPHPPGDWTVVTRDLWQDFGDFTLTGIAPTAIGGNALFDRIELMKVIEKEKQ